MNTPNFRTLPDASAQTLPSAARFRSNGECDAGLVIDCSGSMREPAGSTSRIEAAKAAAMAYVNERSADPGARIAIVSFNDVANIVQRLAPATDLSLFHHPISLLTPGGGTRMKSGVVAVGQALHGRHAGHDDTRQEVVFLTDGHNTGPNPLPDAERLKQQGCRIFTVGIGSISSDVDENLLEAMASPDASGRPLYRFIKDQLRLVRHFEEISRITR